MPNYSFYAVPLAWVIAIAPHFYAIALISKSGNVFDNSNPRSATSQLEGKLPKEDLLTVKRAEGAQSNGFENLGLFATAIVAGNMARLDAETMNFHAGLYLGLRVLYNFLYINTTSYKTSYTRSLVYLGSMMTMFSLFVRAGNKVF